MNNQNLQSDLINQRKNYNGIDVIKFLCSVLVFFIHIPLFYAPVDGDLTTVQKSLNFILQQYVCRLAVPFFFVSSGFFLFKKALGEKLDVDRVKNYCFKILRLLGMWSVLLLIGGSGHLWYLGATAVAVAFISVCLHFKIKYRYLVVIVGLLYILGLIGDSYYGVLEPALGNTLLRYMYAALNLVTGKSRNGLFMGSVFILIGVYFSQGKVKMKLWTSVVGFIVSMLGMLGELFVLEHYDIPSDYNMYIFLVPAVFFLFSIACTVKLKDRPIYARLRTIGVLVYFLHVFVNTLIGYVAKGAYKFLSIDIQPYRCLIALVITLLLTIGIEWLSRKERFKWIKWFLS
ncbi:MAG: acyltransferase family protein [Acutalibacteraceae bacterium]|nr:acyltransferase family protein [Acutalibacteraceae bacterium]